MSKTYYTKEMYRTVVALWATHTKAVIAEKLGVKAGAIGYMATRLRENGLKLPTAKYTRSGVNMVRELVAELKAKHHE